MLVKALAFLTGIMAATHLTKMPSIPILVGLGSLGCGLGVGYFIRPHVKGLIPGFMCLLGFFWCFFRILFIMEPGVSPALLGKNITVTGTIISIPESHPTYLRFDFEIDSILDPVYTIKHPIKVLLTHYFFYQKPSRIQLNVGDRLPLIVRLKRVRGFWNSGCFDMQSRLFQRSIVLTGTIQKLEIERNQSNKVASSFSSKIDQWRAQLAHTVQSRLPESPLLGLLNALIIGLRYEITESQWHIMRATGTNHLFAISGLHIGFVSGLVYGFVHFVWCCIPRLLLLWPARLAALNGALLAAIGYSVLSGFALPVQRALIMFSIWVGTTLFRRVLSHGYSWSLALLGVLIFDPLSVLTESFWLSFGAVAMIFYGSEGRLLAPASRWSLVGLWHRWGQSQWTVTLGLIPLSLLFFQQISWSSFIANLIAIPWVGFLVLPFSLCGALLGLLWPSLGHLFLMLGEKSMSIIWELLSAIASFPGLQGVAVIGNFGIFMTTMMSIILILAPRGLPGKYYLSSLGILPLLLWKPPVPASHEIWLTVLDVGQGLSAVVRTQHHTLIYDTGPKWGPNADAGSAVVLPFLKKSGICKIDRLIISHSDNDHRGGANSLLSNQPVNSLLANDPEALKPHLATLCHRGQHWEWDGVQFEILHPSEEEASMRGNDRSCVLRVSNGAHSLLLPGDIHKRGERLLLNRAINSDQSLKATLLLAPHHGSKTSSSADFIYAIQPRYVIFPVGYQNRFHFPHVEVLQRYQAQGVYMYSTAEEGAITFKFGQAPHDIAISRYQMDQLAFWKTYLFSTPIRDLNYEPILHNDD